jgi:methylaspartate ammonia-lyase
MNDLIRDRLYLALRKKYEAQIAEAEATLAIYFNSPVAIGEHPQQLEEMDKLIEALSNAKDKLQNLITYIDELIKCS